LRKISRLQLTFIDDEDGAEICGPLSLDSDLWHNSKEWVGWKYGEAREVSARRNGALFNYNGAYYLHVKITRHAIWTSSDCVNVLYWISRRVGWDQRIKQEHYRIIA